MMWRYLYGDEIAAQVGRPDVPEVGLEVTIVGRLGIPAPAEHFVVAAVDPVKRTATLRRR